MFHVFNITTIISTVNERERIINIASKHQLVEVNLKFVPRVLSQLYLAYMLQHGGITTAMAKMDIRSVIILKTPCQNCGNILVLINLREGPKSEKYMEYLNY